MGALDRPDVEALQFADVGARGLHLEDVDGAVCAEGLRAQARATRPEIEHVRAKRAAQPGVPFLFFIYLFCYTGHGLYRP